MDAANRAFANVAIKPSAINKRGVFAAKHFRKGEIVISWENTKKLTQAEYDALPPNKRNYIEMQNGTILLVGEPERYVNHSCDPNTISDNCRDVTIRDITVGEEITTDYNDFYLPNGHFACTCGSKLCRGVITGRKDEAIG